MRIATQTLIPRDSQWLIGFLIFFCDPPPCFRAGSVFRNRSPQEEAVAGVACDFGRHDGGSRRGPVGLDHEFDGNCEWFLFTLSPRECRCFSPRCNRKSFAKFIGNSLSEPRHKSNKRGQVHDSKKLPISINPRRFCGIGVMSCSPPRPPFCHRPVRAATP